VSSLGCFLIALFYSLYSTVPGTIERAFLENDAGLLASLFSREAPFLVSLPEPITFSDIITDEQAFLVFEHIFLSNPTIEFFPDSRRAPVFRRGGFILKGRWSFIDRETKDQHPLQIFIRLRPNTESRSRKPLWLIAEIRAEKI
jgi:hypothetical protein